jgi:hypothetical protein
MVLTKMRTAQQWLKQLPNTCLIHAIWDFFIEFVNSFKKEIAQFFSITNPVQYGVLGA